MKTILTVIAAIVLFFFLIPGFYFWAAVIAKALEDLKEELKELFGRQKDEH